MTQVVVGQILNGIILGSLYGIIALGVTMTFGITGIVNFALGQFMMIGAYATWYFTDLAMLPFPVAVVLAVALAAVAGLVADQALFRFTRNNLVNGLLVSIGLISVMESGALLLFTTTPKNMDVVIAGSWSSRRDHFAAHEGGGVPLAGGGDRADVARSVAGMARPRDARLRAEPGGRDADGCSDQAATDRRRGLFLCAGRLRRCALRQPVFAGAIVRRPVHS